MSLNLNGIGGYGQPVAPLQSTTAGQSTSDAQDTSTSWSPDVDDAVSVELSGIPSEVSAAINNASGTYSRLAAGGQHVQFNSDPQTGAFSAQLQNADGSTHPLSARDVLRIASGEDLD